MSAYSPLSEQELRYLADRDFLTAKHRIQEMLRRQLEQAQLLLQKHRHSFDLPDAFWKVPPKISRGENYEQLPYLVLDYPRIFQQEDVFAYRCMIRWGHEISCSLQLGGAYWQQHQKALLNGLAAFTDATDWWVCVHTSPWEYHFRPDNYLPLRQVLEAGGLESFSQMSFFKLSRRLPLLQYEALPAFSLQTLQQFSRLIS